MIVSPCCLQLIIIFVFLPYFLHTCTGWLLQFLLCFLTQGCHVLVSLARMGTRAPWSYQVTMHDCFPLVAVDCFLILPSHLHYCYFPTKCHGLHSTNWGSYFIPEIKVRTMFPLVVVDWFPHTFLHACAFFLFCLQSILLVPWGFIAL